jgi:hypothetical protein
MEYRTKGKSTRNFNPYHHFIVSKRAAKHLPVFKNKNVSYHFQTRVYNKKVGNFQWFKNINIVSAIALFIKWLLGLERKAPPPYISVGGEGMRGGGCE